MNYENFEHILYTNQNCVETDKQKLPGEIWSSYCIEDLSKAIQNLSKGGLELYLYLISNVDGYKFGLGPAPVKNFTGMSAKTYQRAVAELKEQGYLTYNGEFVKGINGVTAPKWYFHSKPQVKNV